MRTRKTDERFNVRQFLYANKRIIGANSEY